MSDETGSRLKSKEECEIAFSLLNAWVEERRESKVLHLIVESEGTAASTG